MPADAAPHGRLRFPPLVRKRIAQSGARILVTGASGWLGQATLEMLDEAFGDRMPERVVAFASTGRDLALRSGRRVTLAPLSGLADLPKIAAPTLLAHYAFLTREQTVGRTLDDYVAANRAITGLVIREAERLGIAGTFSTSSGAVYRRDGSLEVSLEANPYGALKLEEEAAFASLAARGGGPAAICRVFNLGGPFINKTYALSSFLESALAGRDIVVEATRPVIRSYAHVADVVSVGLAGALGLGPASADPYDTAGDEAVEVGALARRILAVLGLPGAAVIRPPMADVAPDRYAGDRSAFLARAEAAGIRLAGLDAQIANTAAFMRDASES